MQDATWWQRGIIYQIYPRSFQDSDGDGVGDLRGITGRLDYLVALGVDALWLSPIQPSPMADFGYDVADYCGIDPLFGTLDDFDRLVSEAHGRGLKVILDFVPNHSSDQHPWFIESRSSHAHAKRDWYIWRDPRPDGGPPNNWLSHFGGPAWEWDAKTGQYYYHAFLKQQPDLNWRNPAMCDAMRAVLRFWLERGVDGFRVDTIWLLIKDAHFRDNPPNPAWHPGERSYRRLLPLHDADQPEVHEVIAGMRSVLDAYDQRLLIGEIYLPIDRLVTYYGHNLSEAHLPFNFQLLLAPWDAGTVARIIREYEAALPPGAWPNWVLGNHDRSRVASRIGTSQARIAAMLLLTLRGTPTIYCGDEIGMTDVPIPPDCVQDPAEKNEPGLGLGRDPERTPMPWDRSTQGGFTTGKPWLPLDRNHPTCNVAAEMEDPSSMLSLYRNLITLRRTRLALSLGEIEAVATGQDLLSYQRRFGSEVLKIVLNFAHASRSISVGSGRVLLSTFGKHEREATDGLLVLGPDEGVIVDVDQCAGA